MSEGKNILDAIGATPLIRLNRVNNTATILAKLEFMNPSGSIKDRIALSMLEDAERKELVNKNSVIIEPTSGNTGVALAMVCAVKGYQCIIVMPEHMSEERIKLLKALGARVVLTPENGDVEGAVRKAEELAKEVEHAIVLHQFKNPANIQAHYEKTGKEILEQVDRVNAFVAGVGTGGTLMGVGRALKEKCPEVKIIAVEPEESAVLSGEKRGKHKIQGIGDGFIPELVDLDLIDEVFKVKSIDAIKMAKTLAREEGLLVGISSGANIYAAIEVAKRMGKDKVILTILPDRAERYFTTELFKD